jgi:hypothetical protein
MQRLDKIKPEAMKPSLVADRPAVPVGDCERSS